MVSTVSDAASARRLLIDLIAETRSRAVRVALFGALVHRPDPDGIDVDNEGNLRVLLDTARWIERVASLVETQKDPWEEIPEDQCAWLSSFVADNPIIVEKLRTISELSSRVAVAAEDGSEDLGPALRAHYAFRRDGFMGVVGNFCDQIWASIDEERQRAIKQTRDVGTTIRNTMERLESIGKHVRLVSINASVEAARLGDSGQGIGFIAKEFKTLAEEVQKLAISARADVASIVSIE